MKLLSAYLTDRRNQQTRKMLTAALTRTHERFVRRYPCWAASLFDKHFLHHRVAPLLKAHWQRHEPLSTVLTADILARLWASQLPYREGLKERVVVELTPAAADFLVWLEQELKCQLASSINLAQHESSMSC